MSAESIVVNLETAKKLKEEVWAWVDGWDAYQISSLGRVRRHYKNGTARILKPSSTRGYAHISLSKNDVKTNRRIARLVAEAFIPNPLNKPQVNHKDGNKANDWVCNLEWATGSENTQHAVDTGLRARVQGVALQSQNGRPPWNKGRKTGQIPWNKSFPLAA
jgi:hypothetical protein